MYQHQHTVIIQNVLAEYIFLKNLTILDIPLDIRSLCIHYVNIIEILPSMLLHKLHMLWRIIARTVIGGITLYHCTVHLIYNRLIEFRMQEVLIAVLSAVYLHCNLARKLYTKLLVQLKHSLRC